jgi:hypothetical protein
MVCNPQDVIVNYWRSKEFSMDGGGWMAELLGSGWLVDLKVSPVVGAMGAAPTKSKRPPADAVRRLGLETDGCPAWAIPLDPHDLLNTLQIIFHWNTEKINQARLPCAVRDFYSWRYDSRLTMTTMAALAFYFLLLISEASIAAAQILENTIHVEVRRKPESRRRGHMVMHRRAPLNWHRVLALCTKTKEERM